MARKKSNETWLDDGVNSVYGGDEKTVSPESKVEDNTTINKKEDPLADKVKALRDKGFDNNRIAAMLMISRTIIDKI